MIAYVCTAVGICHIDLEMRFVRQSLVRDVINVPTKVDDMVTIPLGNLNLGHKAWGIVYEMCMCRGTRVL